MRPCRYMRIILSLAMALPLVACRAPTPPAAQILGEDVTLLRQQSIGKGVAMVGQRPSGGLILGLWDEKAGVRTVTKEEGSSTAPLSGWQGGYAVVAGYLSSADYGQVELLNEQGQILKGKMESGAFLMHWKSTQTMPRFLIRILDSTGKEIYRWPPAGGLPAAFEDGRRTA